MLPVLAACLFSLLASSVAVAQTPTATTYEGPSYPTNVTLSPTSDKPQSKVWHHAGSWWALMLSAADNRQHIFRLEADHTWRDTGTSVDNRWGSRADVLLDGDKLYVGSRTNSGNPRLYRLTYQPATNGWSLDPGFPVDIGSGGSRSLTIAKDSTGRLWATYTRGSPTQVYVSHSTTSDAAWSAPFVLPVGDTTITTEDLSTIVAWDGKVGVMWSNQLSGSYRFAVHRDGDPADSWSQETALSGPELADDHLNIKASSDGRLYAAVKTSEPGASASRVRLLVRDTDGTWRDYAHSTRADDTTRPAVVLDEVARRVYVLATAPEAAGAIYYKSSPMDQIAFAPGRGDPLVEWAGAKINNVTVAKQATDVASDGLVALATDETTGRYYHAELRFASGGTAPGGTASIDSGPQGVTGTSTPTFSFSATSSDATFRCQVDGAQFAACSGPGNTHTTQPLADGGHTFTVEATDSAGNAVTASRTFTVDTTAPTVQIDSGPSGRTTSTTSTFSFSGADTNGLTFRCRVDGAQFAACSGPGNTHTTQPLALGDHTFAVEATDGAGNTTIASRAFTVVKKKR